MTFVNVQTNIIMLNTDDDDDDDDVDDKVKWFHYVIYCRHGSKTFQLMTHKYRPLSIVDKGGTLFYLAWTKWSWSVSRPVEFVNLNVLSFNVFLAKVVFICVSLL